ncbi:MFS transporter [Rubinisphaera sp.]|uniref:MFS transporter n=1 Tax=Rubinisphaera sp. TaxID=2024857 RepID=UPI000C0CE6DE|nr:MFS transporter [Rubinisphaera sp.]MBV12182.1 hypothetical protein [Rubinisphaera sp.]
MSTQPTEAISSNAYRLLWAGFTAILAAGVGFAIRGGILDNWAGEYGFTNSQLGAIGGAGFTGFCFGIIIGGVIVDKIGYGWLVVAAFVFHVASAIVTFMPTPDMAQGTVYAFLFWGTFLFAIANGTLEAVANPLVATLFPTKRTHYLNILHASWPAGLVLGSAMGWVLDDRVGMHWKFQLALFLLPTIVYGLMFFGQKFPKSEASESGLSLGEMLREVGIFGGAVACFFLALFFAGVLGPIFPDAQTGNYVGYAIGGVLLIAVGILTNFSLGSWLIFVLFITHALVGAVELGTDGWIQNITGNILSSEQGKWLFVYTSTIMFLLRFCADFIEKKLGLSPIGILLVCSILACVGLNLASGITTFAGALVALGVYAVGKTFFWPTMLAVIGDRFPRTGAVAMSIMGGIGMMSAGLIGSAGLGYAKDRYAGETLKVADVQVYEEYKADSTSQFLFFGEVTGLDGQKFEEIKKLPEAERSEAEKLVVESSITGDRKTLVADSFIPGTMAVIYLLLFFYFKSIGGYKTVHLAGTKAEEIDKNDVVIPAHES